MQLIESRIIVDMSTTEFDTLTAVGSINERVDDYYEGFRLRKFSSYGDVRYYKIDESQNGLIKKEMTELNRKEYRDLRKENGLPNFRLTNEGKEVMIDGNKIYMEANYYNTYNHSNPIDGEFVSCEIEGTREETVVVINKLKSSSIFKEDKGNMSLKDIVTELLK